MRSAIFDKDPHLFLEPKRLSKSRNLLKNTSPSISSINSPIIRQKSKPATLQLGEYSRSSNDNKKNTINGTNIAWNLDEMLNSYVEHRVLPPILSPTIPQDQSAQGEEKLEGKVDLLAKSTDSLANENLPLSMLSPTLPVMFDSKEATPNSNYPKLVQPKPKQAILKSTSKLVDLSIKEPQLSRPKVRWIDKSQEIRPKFLLRINFRNQPKYKHSFNIRKPDSPKKYNGLGILSSNNEPITKEIQQHLYKEPTQETKSKKEGNNNAKQSEKAYSKKEDSKHEKQQIREEQLKKLNSEILQKEQAQQTDLERLRILKSQSPLILNQLKLAFTEEEREEYKANLILKKNYWIKIARQTKAEADKTKDPILSIVISIDALLLYMIAYDYDEKLKLIAEVLPLERYWNSLYQDCTNLIVQLKQNISKNISNEKYSSRIPLTEYIQSFIGILYQMKAIILKQVNSVFHKVIDEYMFKKNNNKNDLLNELNNKIIELQQSTISNYNKAITNFAKAESYFSMTSQVSVIFPKTWYNKSPHMNPVQTYETSFVPGGDNYFLPIGMYTELREISGFMFSCLREFSKLFQSNNADKFETAYVLQSGLKGAPTDEVLVSKS